MVMNSMLETKLRMTNGSAIQITLCYQNELKFENKLNTANESLVMIKIIVLNELNE